MLSFVLGGCTAFSNTTRLQNASISEAVCIIISTVCLELWILNTASLPPDSDLWPLCGEKTFSQWRSVKPPVFKVMQNLALSVKSLKRCVYLVSSLGMTISKSLPHPTEMVLQQHAHYNLNVCGRNIKHRRLYYFLSEWTHHSCLYFSLFCQCFSLGFGVN